MLEQDPTRWRRGDTLPRGWHFGLFAPAPPQSSLRKDGYAGPGIALPDAGLPRLMLGGCRLRFSGDIPIGAALRRRTRLLSAAPKEGRSGRMVVATVGHTVLLDGAPVLAEEQDFILMEAGPPPTAPLPGSPTPGGTAFIADERLLLRFCALTFNTHRIHYDFPFAKDVEGHEALVVNGSLTGLMLTELFRNQAGREPVSVASRNLRPLFCGRTNRLHAQSGAEAWRVWAEDDAGRLAVEAEIR
jgi:3-methylfumaryl-CoA hydratase